MSHSSGDKVEVTPQPFLFDYLDPTIHALPLCSTGDPEARNSRYGAQLLSYPPAFTQTVFGSLGSDSAFRILQLNKMVTSGVQPDGLVISYDRLHPEYQKVSEEVAEDKMFCRPGDGLSIPPYKEDGLSAAALLATRLRGEQRFTDGNHRTALIGFTFALAASNHVLSADFDILKAYMLISARDHPGNKDNSLGPKAQQEVAVDLEAYAREFIRLDKDMARRVGHLAWAVERVRRLPLAVLASEAVVAIPRGPSPTIVWNEGRKEGSESDEKGDEGVGSAGAGDEDRGVDEAVVENCNRATSGTREEVRHLLGPAPPGLLAFELQPSPSRKPYWL